jgi:hypothetical protein
MGIYLPFRSGRQYFSRLWVDLGSRHFGSKTCPCLLKLLGGGMELVNIQKGKRWEFVLQASKIYGY